MAIAPPPSECVKSSVKVSCLLQNWKNPQLPPKHILTMALITHCKDLGRNHLGYDIKAITGQRREWGKVKEGGTYFTAVIRR